MTQTNEFADAKSGPVKAAPAGADDLSEEISRSVEKQPGDFVRCTRVCNDNYRCNWWAALPAGSYDGGTWAGLLITTQRVRQSRFLRVTRRGERLVIEEIAGPVAAP